MLCLPSPEQTCIDNKIIIDSKDLVVKISIKALIKVLSKYTTKENKLSFKLLSDPMVSLISLDGHYAGSCLYHMKKRIATNFSPLWAVLIEEAKIDAKDFQDLKMKNI